MPLFEFCDLVRKYAVSCTVVAFDVGGYDAGEYVAGESTETDVCAALISMSQQKVYQSGGHYTSADREFYILVSDDPIRLGDGKKYYVVHNDMKYAVEASGDYGEDYADFNHYTLRRVDSFDV